MEINKLKHGQEIQLEISDLAFGGEGISKIDDLIFFVKDTIPNQTVIAKISKIKKKYIEAYNIETLKKSIDEIDPKCEHFKYCGGCSTQQLNYEKQLYYKQNQVYDIFERIGKIKNPDLNPIIRCDNIFYYRNKMKYTFSDNPWYVGNESSDNIVIGLHVSKSFDKILDINTCHINHKVFNDIISIAKKISINENIIPYDVVKHSGFLRYLILRIGVHTDEIMVNLVTSGDKPKLIESIVNEMVNKIPNVTSIVNTINVKKNNVTVGSTRLLYNQDFITEKIGNYSFKISANSFFQTNSYQVKILYDYIIKTAKFNTDDVVYDLYCGTGTIGIYISSFVKKVYGIEINEDAIKDAKYNIRINKINNIEFFLYDLKDFFNNSEHKIEKPDIVIIDPPRPGLHPDVINDLINLDPRKIIYVSCNPPTQARDIKIFMNKKYKINDIQPIDMFPHTPHIECIVTLKK